MRRLPLAQLDPSDATDGQAAVWSAGDNAWIPGEVLGSGDAAAAAFDWVEGTFDFDTAAPPGASYPGLVTPSTGYGLTTRTGGSTSWISSVTVSGHKVVKFLTAGTYLVHLRVDYASGYVGVAAGGYALHATTVPGTPDYSTWDDITSDVSTALVAEYQSLWLTFVVQAAVDDLLIPYGYKLSSSGATNRPHGGVIQILRLVDAAGSGTVPTAYVESIAAGESSIVIGGTATNPTISVADSTLVVAESQVTSLVADLALKAPLASPALTGNPTAPTQSSSDNDTSIATTAFVQTASGLLVPKSLIDAKGDLFVGTANDTVARLAVGTDTWVLTADSAQAAGVKWAASAGGGGGSVNSVTAGDGTVTIGGTASDPTVAVNAIAESQVTSLVSDLAAKAPLASPTLTGDPKAPTPAPGDNDTSIATTAFVATSYAPIASPTLTGDPKAPTASPGDNDTSIATTAFVTTADNLKANIASPTFTGNPAAPTPSPGDNDTSLATTAFVTAAVAAAARSAVFKIPSTLAGGFTGATRLYNDTGATWTILSVRATVETQPSGGSVVVDVNKNGTTIFTNQAHRPTILTATNTSGKVTNADVTSVADGDYITVDVDSTTSPAADLTLTLVVSY